MCKSEEFDAYLKYMKQAAPNSGRPSKVEIPPILRLQILIPGFMPSVPR
jgi:hypothetical protein